MRRWDGGSGAQPNKSASTLLPHRRRSFGCRLRVDGKKVMTGHSDRQLGLLADLQI
jgi:hypothetical protein